MWSNLTTTLKSLQVFLKISTCGSTLLIIGTGLLFSCHLLGLTKSPLNCIQMLLVHWVLGEYSKPNVFLTAGVIFAGYHMRFVGLAFSNKPILYYFDSKSVVSIVSSKWSHIPRIMDLEHYLTLFTSKCNKYIRVEHIAGKKNEITDSISRFQFECFSTSTCRNELYLI